MMNSKVQEPTFKLIIFGGSFALLGKKFLCSVSSGFSLQTVFVLNKCFRDVHMSCDRGCMGASLVSYRHHFLVILCLAVNSMHI